MFRVYVLKSLRNNKRYVGYTSKLAEKRLWEHNNGSNKFTKQNGPFVLFHQECYATKTEAIEREKFLKSGQGRKFLDQIMGGQPLTQKANIIMFCIYLIKSKKDESLYIGYTNDLTRRLAEHNNNRSIATKGKGPYELIYCEAYKSMKDAKYREGNLKRFSQAYTQLKRRIKNSLEQLSG